MNRTAVVGNEAAFAETIQEEAHTRARCPDHFGKCLLTNPRNYTEDPWTLACSSEVEQKASKALFAGIENVIGQVSLHAQIARSELSDEFFSHGRLVLENGKKRTLFKPDNLASLHCHGGHDTNGLTRETTLSKESVFTQNVYDRLFAISRHYSQLYFTALDIKHSVGRFALQKDRFIRGVLTLGPSDRETSEQLAGGKDRGLLRHRAH